MGLSEKFKGQNPAWCPGCGNFAILNVLKRTFEEMALEPHEITIVSGIGQGAKLPHYTRCHTFNGLHGRTLPVATGLALANPLTRIIAIAGDGDCYGEGGNHLLHAIRRNPNITLLVHNNQVYGLTKGQASPTSDPGFKTKLQMDGVILKPFNPLALGIIMDVSFVARSSAVIPEHLQAMMKLAIQSPGFALLDILQPCVSFNQVNTYKWYQDRVRELPESFDPENRDQALVEAMKWGEEIPAGVLYRSARPAFEDASPILNGPALVTDFVS